jgi:hypothetical protein
MLKSSLIFACLAGMATVLVPTDAEACSCSARTLDEAYDASTNMIRGRPMGTALVTRKGGLTVREWYVDVSEDYKSCGLLKENPATGLVTLVTPATESACGVPVGGNFGFQLKKEYLIEVNVNGLYSINFCGLRVPFADLDAGEVAWLEDQEGCEP